MTEIILASASAARKAMLTQAGVSVTAIAAPIDEASYKRSLKAEGATAAQVADTLAEMKAIRLSRKYPNALVIAADQMLDCGGVWFDKPQDRDQGLCPVTSFAKQTPQIDQRCRGVQSFGSVMGGQRIRADLEMRLFTDAFLNAYLDQAGETVLASVGAYQLEGLGAQLFKKIEGDYFTILGLPLLPLLGFFARSRGAESMSETVKLAGGDGVSHRPFQIPAITRVLAAQIPYQRPLSAAIGSCKSVKGGFGRFESDGF